MSLSLNARTRLLVVAPHPDDESIATGELILQVRQAGGEVQILLLTNGDNNPWPQRWVERRLRIGADERRRWGERRPGATQTGSPSPGGPGVCRPSFPRTPNPQPQRSRVPSD